jgi:hypothetical protein
MKLCVTSCLLRRGSEQFEFQKFLDALFHCVAYTSFNHRSYKIPNSVGMYVFMNLGVDWMQAHFKGMCASAEYLKKSLNSPDRIASSLPNIEVL